MTEMRPMHKWNVVLQREDGEIIEREYLAPWNPEKDFVTPESIAQACAAEEYVRRGAKVQYAPVSAQLVK